MVNNMSKCLPVTLTMSFLNLILRFKKDIVNVLPVHNTCTGHRQRHVAIKIVSKVCCSKKDIVYELYNQERYR